MAGSKRLPKKWLWLVLLLAAWLAGLSTHQPLLGQMIAALGHETGERLAAAGLELDWPIGKLDDEEYRLDYPTFRSLTSAHREIVSNIIRHARARNVEIRIEEVGDCLEMAIADDGIGINPASAAGHAQGNGISGLMRRIGDIEGTMSLEPKASGTLVRISIPLRAKIFVHPSKDADPEPCGSPSPHI